VLAKYLFSSQWAYHFLSAELWSKVFVTSMWI